MSLRHATSWLLEMFKMNMFPRFPGQESVGKKDDTKEGSGALFGFGDERDMSAISSFLQGEQRKMFTDFVLKMKQENPGELSTIMQVFSVRMQEDNRAKMALGASGTITSKVSEVCTDAITAKNNGNNWFATMREGFAIEAINSRDLFARVVWGHVQKASNILDDTIAKSAPDSLIRKLDQMGGDIRAGTYDPNQSDISIVKALSRYDAERKKRYARAAQWWNPF